MEFFLNVFTEFSDKIFDITVKGLEPLPISHLLCLRPACYHSTSKTHVRDRNFNLNPIHASMIISSLNSLNSVKVMLHLGKTRMEAWKRSGSTRRQGKFKFTTRCFHDEQTKLILMLPNLTILHICTNPKIVPLLTRTCCTCRIQFVVLTTLPLKFKDF